MARRVKPRPPKAAPPALSVGQLALDSDQSWAPTGCECFPPVPRVGCQHCKTCDTCQDCRRCAGRGCECACQG